MMNCPLLDKCHMDVIIDASDLQRAFRLMSTTGTPTGKFVYKFDSVGKTLFNPITNTCVSTVYTEHDLSDLLSVLSDRHVRYLTSRIRY